MADSTDTTDSAAPDGLPDPVAAGGHLASDARRVLWLVGLAVAGAVILLAVWLFRMVSTERTLRAVTSSVTVPATPPPMPSTPPTPPVPAAPVAPPVPVAPALPPGPGATPAPPSSGAAAGAAAPDAEPRKVARTAKSSKKAKRAAKRRETAAARGTFARCPSLGKPGAVMCRWHICNGGAGKEAACRPYLERRP
ncbi:hypothetical protein ACFFTM_02590 [Pseudoduganella plicata]|uniref:Uncharacterized protein n=1 Tax=Pseudoduganella plicata TaxID=321984 RepID=A0A4P7BBF9_9BURK|nr:hypothetical protein [Pseudoduganella plicata]QBQ35167.1 hypothetical protein E1742_02540 [Pseudoduganella plicata]GGZ05318.1 hypothetical protein GCM10007388_43750 [Pseudoduganella plicata]